MQTTASMQMVIKDLGSIFSHENVTCMMPPLSLWVTEVISICLKHNHARNAMSTAMLRMVAVIIQFFENFPFVALGTFQSCSGFKVLWSLPPKTMLYNNNQLF
jgi:hypothetical protein